jgi:hypothetical protein
LDAYDWNWGYHNITNQPDLNITLKNSAGSTVATAGNFGGTNTMQFTWVRAN